ncbi:hypothetical protein MCG98_09710 [Ruminococcus sp. OA3]|uniref:hypothetical protein n=1 Tax=Ruminococcus sp. OA3 TaxID=2914164 RepID=UPI001F06C128|nr:hypothetical protein [Ruminococcus sp. OA3]MCH1982840.1 hypothetical protein [Ruminococcus sp. OA3]
MNKSNMNDYHLRGSIHTLTIKSNGIVTNVDDAVKRCITSITTTNNGLRTSSKLNLNNLTGDINTYPDFLTALDTVTAGAGIHQYDLVRVDMRFDSSDDDHYIKYAKLNRLLISMLACAYHVRNCYKTVDLFTEQQLSVAIKNDDFEVENYDKRAESGGTDTAKSRLEIRSKRMRGQDISYEFTVNWNRRWEKALQHFSTMQQRYNDGLERIYHQSINAYPKKFKNITDFLMQYQNCIFCKEQMIDLLQRLNTKNPETKFQNYKSRYGIDLFTITDARHAIGEIQRATRTFFEPSELIAKNNSLMPTKSDTMLSIEHPETSSSHNIHVTV